MNKKRTITIRHPQLAKFRNTLREIIFRATLVEFRTIRKNKKGLVPIEGDIDLKQMKDLSNKRDKLDTAWKKSICTCSLCGSRTSDMTFNTYFGMWFCLECYEKSQEFYRKKTREGEIWTDNSASHVPSTRWWP